MRAADKRTALQMWLHRHVWRRTGWRWAYSPSQHWHDVGQTIAREWQRVLR